ncbi:MAG: hypothetical protein H6745_33645 [Deltaproteobacteria bacterium]|nr:hypothetical protein [Deltaproteobacteria bacterium]
MALATGTAPTPLGVGLAVAGLLLGAHALDDAAAGATSLVGALVARGVVADPRGGAAPRGPRRPTSPRRRPRTQVPPA